MLSQLFQHLLIDITSNEHHLKTDPPTHERNKLIPNANTAAPGPHLAITEPPFQIPQSEAIIVPSPGPRDVTTLNDVQFLEVRKDGGGDGGNPESVAPASVPVQP